MPAQDGSEIEEWRREVERGPSRLFADLEVCGFSDSQICRLSPPSRFLADSRSERGEADQDLVCRCKSALEKQRGFWEQRILKGDVSGGTEEGRKWYIDKKRRYMYVCMCIRIIVSSLGLGRTDESLQTGSSHSSNAYVLSSMDVNCHLTNVE